MKNIKRILAAAITVLMVLSFAACHKKNETAVKVGDIKFSSGYYACVLFFTDSQARSKVESEFEEKGDDTTDIDYYKQKIDGKSYTDWVKDETINTLKKIAAAKLLCKKAEIDDSEAKTQAETYAGYYWDSYGYSVVLSENGVSKETFVAYMTDLSYEDLYFDYLFGAEGEKAVSEEQLKEELSKNYALADMLDVDFTDLEDDVKTEKTEQLNIYLEQLKSKKATFEEVYHDYNGEEEEEQTTESSEDTPLDSHATLIGNSETNSENEYFDDIYAMANGEVKIIDKTDDSGKILVVKKDVMADPYYLKSYDNTLRHAIADEDFKKIIEDYAETLRFKEITSATKAFKVKKIYYPESAN